MESGTHLAGAADDVAEGGELFEADRPAGVQAAGGDADFPAEAEFAAVAELGGGVPEADGAGDVGQEGFGGFCVLGDDGVGMLAAMGGDVGEGFLETGDDFHAQYRVQPFGIEILGAGGGKFGEDGAGGRVGAQRAAEPGEVGGDDRQQVGRNGGQDALPIGLCVSAP